MYTGDPAHDTTVDGVTVKIRDPWRVGIFTLITLGIYGLVWFYMINRELNDWAKARGVHGVAGNPVLATIGYLIPVVNVGVWIWTLARIRRAQAAVSSGPPMSWGSTVIAAIVGLVPLVGVVIWHEHVQHHVNLVWQPVASPQRGTSSGAGPEAVPSPA
jgi:hypothetical protein